MVEEIVRQALGQDGPYVTLLKQEGIVAERGAKFLQAFGQARVATDAFQLGPQHACSHGSLPDFLERRRFLKVRPHLAFQNHPRHRLLERLRRSDLMGVVDALDRFLGPDAVLEGQIASQSPGGGSKQSAGCED